MDTSTSPAAAVIIDIVRSRQMVSRASMQPQIEQTFRFVNEHVAAEQAIRATVGDEFQGVFRTVADALEATMIARLALPASIDCRFGIGLGSIETVGEGTTGILQDGPGWWHAREAIDEAHSREDGRNPTLRTWFCAGTGAAHTGDDVASGVHEELSQEAVVNAYLLTRDHIISTMNDRARRVVLGTALGRSQSELADEEDVSQSAVSQTLRKSGGWSLLSSLETLKAGAL